jgi:hypothetical protein
MKIHTLDPGVLSLLIFRQHTLLFDSRFKQIVITIAFRMVQCSLDVFDGRTAVPGVPFVSMGLFSGYFSMFGFGAVIDCTCKTWI